MIALLANGQIEQAEQTAELFLGRAETASSNPGLFSEAVESGENSESLADMSSLSDDEMRQILGFTGLTEWMLFLHPDQRKLVEREYQGPARLVGVSGSGKTSVLVHRANYLAKKYDGERILILSLNAALCRLISTLLDTLCTPIVRRHIAVMTIYQYCYQAVKAIEPGRLIEKQDPLSGEDLVACWRDFMEKPHALDRVNGIIDALQNRRDHVDGRAYLLR